MNTIYFLCPDSHSIRGGVKQIYRQVDILNKNGITAYVLHQKDNFRGDFWFNSNAKVISDKNLLKLLKINLFIKNKILRGGGEHLYKLIRKFIHKRYPTILEPDSILVIPEIYGPYTDFLDKKLHMIIFNQNCYYSFQNYDIKKQVPYQTEHIISVSEDSKKYLEFAFPDSKVFRIRLGIDNHTFYFPNQKKKKQIAYMGRKLSEDSQQILAILRHRNKIENWKFINIENKNQYQVAKIMRESAIFLSFNHREGFGLPPAEAMACGCIVIGYCGMGGKEYFNSEFSYPIPDRDITTFAEKIEEIASSYDKKCDFYSSQGRKASEFILNNYSLKNEEKDIIEVWNNILINLQI